MLVCSGLWSIAALATSTLALPLGKINSRQASSVNQTNCNGNAFSYNSLAGYGNVPATARDKFGDSLGGYGSSIAIDQSTWKKLSNGSYTGTLWAIPDRGWYGPVHATNLEPPNRDYRNTEGTLNFQSRIHKFDITLTPQPSASIDDPASPNLIIAYADSILLKGPGGVPTTGLDADATGSQTSAGFPPLPVATFDGDGFGGDGSGGSRVAIDAEGLALAPDGYSFWISDEYGPYIYHFNSTGDMLSAISPPDALIPHRNGSASFSADSPPVFDPDKTIDPEDPATGRANNQGFEGLSLSPDGKTLNALLQSALNQEGGTSDEGRGFARLLQYDISDANNPTYLSEHVVPLPFFTSGKGNTKVAAQSEIHALSTSQFLVLARDSGKGFGQGKSDTESLYRHIDVFDISASATDVKGTSADSVNGSIASTDGKLADGITPATYCSFLDFNVNDQLGRFGLHNGGKEDDGLLNEKWESIALAPVEPGEGASFTAGEMFVFSFSDNDFITQVRFPLLRR